MLGFINGFITGQLNESNINKIHTHMNFELHLTKKDFKVDWFSGSGAGGQHRNKHQNCCRITHLESGLVGLGTESKSRVRNQETAFKRVVQKIIGLYFSEPDTERRTTTDVIRTYHAERNVVTDVNGNTFSFKQTVGKNKIDDLINSRKINKN
jgi:protein subunit release factor A